MIKGKHLFIVLSLLVLLSVQVLEAQEIQTPKSYFGHTMGEDGVIVDYLKSLDYYRELARISPRMELEELGRTTDGNPFILLIISSEKNMKSLEELKRKRDILSDPRKISEAEARKLARELPVVVFHATSIHSSEISTAQVAPELVYKLVTGEDQEMQKTRENAIVLICPSANPDGQIKYNKWYSEHKGKAWEGRMPWLYHTYVGHDNNRDWVNLYFSEQRLTATEIHLKWHPVYSHEMHEFGGTSARIFAPPYKDPIDPNTAPDVVSTMNTLGMATSHALTAEGKAGVVTHAHFDLFTPARAFQVYHGTGRILTETASGRFARTRVVTAEDFSNRRFGSADYHPLKRSWNFPLPWQPGPWTFRDRVEYQLSASFAMMRQAANNSYQFNMAYFKALKWAVEGEGWPYAWILPEDQISPEATRQLVLLLQQGGVEVYALSEKAHIESNEYRAGSKVIFLQQPYGAWAKTLLEIQNYPDLRKNPDDPPVRPYDVTGHTLPLLMGVSALEIKNPFDGNVYLLDSVILEPKIDGCKGDYFALMPQDNSASYLVNKLLSRGEKVWRLKEDLDAGGISLEAGAFIFDAKENSPDSLAEILEGRYVHLKRIPGPLNDKSLKQLRIPRVAVYESWGGMMDSGWTRLVLENYAFPLKVLRNEEIAGGDLEKKYDVIIFPNGLSSAKLLNGAANYPRQYSRGIGKQGVDSINAFLNSGGVVLSWGSSSTRVAELLELPVKDKAMGVEPNTFYAPGSVVLTELETSHPVNYGMQKKIAVQIRRGPLFVPEATLAESPVIVGRYPDYDPRLSGFLQGYDYMQGAGSLMVQNVGEGKVVLFSYLPQFRGMTHATFKQVFNTIFWSVEQ